MSGLEVINIEAGSVQVKNTERPYTLRKSGYIYNYQFQQHASNVLTPVFSHTMNIGAMNAPLIFFRVQGANSRVAALQTSPNVIVFYKWWNLPITSPIEYFIFDDWLPPERSVAGLQMWRETAPYDLVFDSSWNLLKIEEKLVVSAGQPSVTSGDSSTYLYLPTNRSPGSFCVGVAAPRAATFGTSNNEDGTVFTECLWCEGNSVGVSWVPVEGTAGLGGSYFTGIISKKSNNILVADASWLPVPYG
ncbi:hypothetical protein JT27_02155 [Alcaligenes faecalis]|uniref:hypothetical protein n=1 Tax=Alcaligenes faecalis TaxID=511 RepID=UPI00052BD07F|nr:hypothetical protein [Alcaligenes faecalis]KGP03451.1 hypothetical protein JT27_02155 [Alcaligenes faecalis]